MAHNFGERGVGKTSLPRAVGGVGPGVDFGGPDGIAAFRVVRLANSSQITTNRCIASNLGLSAKVVDTMKLKPNATSST